MAEEKLKGSFKAKDGSGNEYIIEIWVEMLTSKLLGGARQKEGMGRLKTDQGKHVNQIENEKGKYEILLSAGNVTVTSDDPSAP